MPIPYNYCFLLIFVTNGRDPVGKGMYKYKYIVGPTLRSMRWGGNTEQKKREGGRRAGGGGEGEGEREKRRNKDKHKGEDKGKGRERSGW